MNCALCQDCVCLVEKNGVPCCDEMWGRPIKDLEECPEGFVETEQEELNAKAKENRADYVSSDAKKQKKPRTSKVSDEKQSIFHTILQNLDRNEYISRENIEILKENKLIRVKIGEKSFKIDIIEERNKK